MSQFPKRVLPPSFLLAGLMLVANSAIAQSYRVEILNAAAPAELAAAVRDSLGSDAFRVVGPQGPLCEIWLRKAVPASASANQGLGIAYGQLSEGTLVGAIRFLAPAKDYRRQEIKPGVFTLRYELQPVDGNHQGVSPFRDYLLLAPAAADGAPAALAPADLLNLSRKASGSGHPSVWSLLAADGAPGSLPALAHVEDGDLWVLYFRAPMAASGGGASSVVMALVVAGHAPES